MAGCLEAAEREQSKRVAWPRLEPLEPGGRARPNGCAGAAEAVFAQKGGEAVVLGKADPIARCQVFSGQKVLALGF